MTDHPASQKQAGSGSASQPDQEQALPPLDVFLDLRRGDEVPLPPELSSLYGPLFFPAPAGRPHVISNFVTTLDGVVSLGMDDLTDGDTVSGFNAHDSMVMALLRAVSSAVIVGAGSLRKSSRHIWTAEHVYPPLAGAYGSLRRSAGLAEFPLNVFVTESGKIDPGLPVFQDASLPSAIVTTAQGGRRLEKAGFPAHVKIVAAEGAPALTARRILETVNSLVPGAGLYLTEGGPHILTAFLAEGCLDELFLTLAPQLAGRDGLLNRMGLVAGRLFSPGHPVWGELASLRRGGSHLFLRYAFAFRAAPEAWHA